MTLSCCDCCFILPSFSQFYMSFGCLGNIGFCARREGISPLDTAHGRRAYCRKAKFGVYGLGWLMRLLLVCITARYCKRYRYQSQTTCTKHFTLFAIQILKSLHIARYIPLEHIFQPRISILVLSSLAIIQLH